MPIFSSVADASSCKLATTTTTATTTAVKAVAADPCNNKRKGKRELRKKEEANERIMVPACWIAHLPHGQEFVGRWHESGLIESHDADMSNVLAAIHYPHSRIVKTRRGCDMRHHKSVHIDACNEISIAMGKVPENVLPLYLSVMPARHVHKLMLIEFLEKIVHMAKEIMEISPDIKDQ